MLDEAPEVVHAVADGAIDECVAENDCEGEVIDATMALPEVQDGVARALLSSCPRQQMAGPRRNF